MTGPFRRNMLATALLAAGFALAAVRPSGAQAADDFADLLADAGVDLAGLAAVAASGRELSPEQAAAIDQALFRLDQLERGQIGSRGQPVAITGSLFADGQPPLAPGTLVQLEGRVVARGSVGRAATESAAPLWRYDVELDAGGQAVVVSPHAPRGWADRETLDEQVSATGAFVGLTGGDRRRSVVLVNRFRWFPSAGVPSGVAWLVAQGFDAALLDDVRPAGAFARPHESRESEAFYAALAAVARGDAGALRRLAQEEVRDAVGRWRAAAGQEAVKADVSRRDARIAAAVARSAERGVSSVGPMYLAPADTMGRLVLLEGVARRAVRIVVDDAATPDGLREYYELDLFTPDSENLPVVCAVARLPAEFPRGDRIQEPVCVAGVFFKRWAYAARPDAVAGQAARRIAAPLVLAPEAQWLRGAAAPAPTQGLWWGLAFAALLAALWLTAARVARSDRLARSRRTSYDAQSGVEAGPPAAES